MSFLFFIKPSKITLDCFTTNVMAFNMAKIEPAIKFIPKWWKNVPSSFGDHPYIRYGTLKGCSGFTSLYKSGFIIPMWCDLAIDIGPIGSESYRYQYSDYDSRAEVHNKQQQGDFCDSKNYQHLKLISPWFIKHKRNFNCLLTDVIWNDVKFPPYRILTGIVNFKVVNGTNINMMFARQENEQQIFIPYKTPLVHIIPLTEQNIKLKHHLVDTTELHKTITQKNLLTTFLNKAKNLN